MDYRFLVSKKLENFFDNTDMSIGDIFRTIMSEKVTGLNITNKSRFQQMTDQDWYEAIELAFNESQEEETFYNDKEWDNKINSFFKDGKQ